MSQDDLDHIPSIVPTRDAPSQGRNRRGRGQQDRRHAAPPPQGGGGGIWARLFITLALVVAAVACAWAWQLQVQLEQADRRLESYADRIGDLEARLSDTDEGMTQTAATQAVRLKELGEKIEFLDSEVRKLWDNVWKESKARLSRLEASSAAHGKDIAAIQGTLDRTAADVGNLKSVAGDMSRLMSSAKANQAEVERVADALNRFELDLAKLGKRVEGNEEWVGSINAFRRQVNATLAELQDTVRALQTPPPGP